MGTFAVLRALLHCSSLSFCVRLGSRRGGAVLELRIQIERLRPRIFARDISCGLATARVEFQCCTTDCKINHSKDRIKIPNRLHWKGALSPQTFGVHSLKIHNMT